LTFIETVGRIRRVGKEIAKRGWFDNVWNVELTVPLDGVIIEEQEHHWSRVTARIVSTTGLDRSRKTKLQDTARSWRKLKHPNVAQVLGLCHGLPPLRAAVIIDCGPTVDILMTHLRETGVGDRLKIITGIASGLEYLHRKYVVHGDLRPANIIVEDGVPMLVDYGLPAYLRKPDDAFVRRLFKAPELLETPKDQEETPTRESDVYALGVTFFEVFAERLPFDGISATKSAFNTEVASKGFKPCHPGSIAERRGLSSDVWTLMCECWSTEASARPSSGTVVQCIEKNRVKATNSISFFQNKFTAL